jgi:hypothetical protein
MGPSGGLVEAPASVSLYSALSCQLRPAVAAAFTRQLASLAFQAGRFAARAQTTATAARIKKPI